jgi:hypothetical protein
MNIVLILETHFPGTKWELDGDNYSGLNWFDLSLKPTESQLSSLWEETISIDKKRKCKETAKKILFDSDWSELPSVIEQLENYLEWKNYRIEIRNFFINPIEEPVFPNEPSVIWKVT